MTIFFAICAAAMVFCVGGLFRNQLVFKARMRRIDEIAEANQRDLGRRDFFAVMNRRYAELDRPSYDAMFWDVRRWTYRQFYPTDVA